MAGSCQPDQLPLVGSLSLLGMNFSNMQQQPGQTDCCPPHPLTTPDTGQANFKVVGLGVYKPIAHLSSCATNCLQTVIFHVGDQQVLVTCAYPERFALVLFSQAR